MDTAHPTLDHPFGDAFEIEFRLDQAAGRVLACRTVGLADFGFPELMVRPDAPFEPTPARFACDCGCPPPWPEPGHRPEDDDLGDLDDVDDDPEQDDEDDYYYLHVVRSAQMMTLLALDVLGEDSLDVLPRSEQLLDLPVRFWLGDPELVRRRPPAGPEYDELTVPVHWVIE